MNARGKTALAFIIAAALLCCGGIVAFALDRAIIGAPLLIAGIVCGMGYLERRCHDKWHAHPSSSYVDNPVVVVIHPKEMPTSK
jgi:hypothetical protein